MLILTVITRWTCRNRGTAKSSSPVNLGSSNARSLTFPQLQRTELLTSVYRGSLWRSLCVHDPWWTRDLVNEHQYTVLQ